MWLTFWPIWKILSAPKLKLILITPKIDTLFSAAVAAAAEIIHIKNTFSSLPNITTCHLKKKLVQNNEKQGRYDQKCIKNQKPDISKMYSTENGLFCPKALKVYITLFPSTDKLFVKET